MALVSIKAAITPGEGLRELRSSIPYWGALLRGHESIKVVYSFRTRLFREPSFQMKGGAILLRRIALATLSMASVMASERRRLFTPARSFCIMRCAPGCDACILHI